jgi:hypothetical protein
MKTIKLMQNKEEFQFHNINHTWKNMKAYGWLKILYIKSVCALYNKKKLYSIFSSLSLITTIRSITFFFFFILFFSSDYGDDVVVGWMERCGVHWLPKLSCCSSKREYKYELQCSFQFSTCFGFFPIPFRSIISFLA